MKLLFISDVPLSFPVSGSEQVLNNEAVGLSRRGFNVYAITRSNGESKSVRRKDVNGVKEACYCANTKNVFNFLASLLKDPIQLYDSFLNNEPFALSFCHQPFTFISLLLNGKLKNTPLVYIFHSPAHEEYLLTKENKYSLLKLPLAHIRKMIEGYCLKRSIKIIVLSQYMKQKAIKIHKISNDLFVMNPGGVDLDRFKPVENRKRIKDQLGYSVGKIHLLTVRNLEPRMGLDNLLRGVYLLKDVNIPIQLFIVGKGPENEKLQKLIKEYGLINDVILTGFIPADKLPQYYCAADFFVLPTRDLEGFGLVTPESMACGTPVLGTPVGGTKEILGNFDSQFLFKDTSPEAIARGIQKAIHIYLGKEKYNKLRTRCREFVVQNYSWEKHLNKLEAIIEELINLRELKN